MEEVRLVNIANTNTNKLSLTSSFEDSLSDNVFSVVSELAEVGLDAIMNDGLLKEVPFLSTIISVYKIGKDIHARHNMKKFVAFQNEINSHMVDNEERQKYISKFKEKQEFRQRELEYLLVVIDRYIGIDKPIMLARLYLAYLQDLLTWKELCMYSEVIDRFLLNDFNVLSVGDVVLTNYNGNEAILRLEALGLMAEKREVNHFLNGGVFGESFEEKSLEKRRYLRTSFGEKLVKIIDDMFNKPYLFE